MKRSAHLGKGLVLCVCVWLYRLDPVISLNATDCDSIAGDTCYYFPGQSLNWSAANTVCEQDGGHLVTVPDAVTHSSLSDVMTSKSWDTMWIGGSGTLKNWTWLTGDPLGSYQPWNILSPDERPQFDCAAMVHYNNFDWEAVACAQVNHFICEFALPHENCSALARSLSLGSRCLVLSNKNSRARWETARETCASDGGHIVVVDSPDVLAAVNETFKDTLVDELSDGVWIGLSRIDWAWVTGETMSYTNWESSSPQLQDSYCVSITKPGTDYYWKDSKCEDILNFGCEASLLVETTATEPVTTQSVIMETSTYDVTVVTETPTDAPTTSDLNSTTASSDVTNATNIQTTEGHTTAVDLNNYTTASYDVTNATDTSHSSDTTSSTDSQTTESHTSLDSSSTEQSSSATPASSTDVENPATADIAGPTTSAVMTTEPQPEKMETTETQQSTKQEAGVETTGNDVITEGVMTTEEPGNPRSHSSTSDLIIAGVVSAVSIILLTAMIVCLFLNKCYCRCKKPCATSSPKRKRIKDRLVAPSNDLTSVYDPHTPETSLPSEQGSLRTDASHRTSAVVTLQGSRHVTAPLKTSRRFHDVMEVSTADFDSGPSFGANQKAKGSSSKGTERDSFRVYHVSPVTPTVRPNDVDVTSIPSTASNSDSDDYQVHTLPLSPQRRSLSPITSSLPPEQRRKQRNPVSRQISKKNTDKMGTQGSSQLGYSPAQIASPWGAKDRAGTITSNQSSYHKLSTTSTVGPPSMGSLFTSSGVSTSNPQWQWSKSVKKTTRVNLKY